MKLKDLLMEASDRDYQNLLKRLEKSTPLAKQIWNDGDYKTLAGLNKKNEEVKISFGKNKDMFSITIFKTGKLKSDKKKLSSKRSLSYDELIKHLENFFK